MRVPSGVADRPTVPGLRSQSSDATKKLPPWSLRSTQKSSGSHSIIAP
jgi:hypothetical protein